MIEYQINPTKRLILKIVAVFLIAAFVWYDISWAGDLYNYNLAHTAQTASTAPTREVTNYDRLSYDTKESVARKLLPTGSDSEQSQQFAPDYIQSQQSKHEEIIRQKQDTQDMLMSLDERLRRKLSNKEDEELDLKKKRGGGGNSRLGASGQPVEYTLSDYDEEGNPQQINIYNYEGGALKSITSYDIRGLDQSKWISGGKEIESKDGDKFFGSYSEADKTGLTDDRILEKVFYSGGAGSERIDYVLSDYDTEGVSHTVSVYDYNKNGDTNENLDEVRSYDSDGIDISKPKSEWASLLTENRLSRTNVYEGEKDKERVKYVLDDYAIEANGNNEPNQVSIYDYNNNAGEDEKNESLDEVRSYDISDYYGTDQWDEVLGELLSDDSTILEDHKLDLESVSLFSGPKGSEVITQAFYYDGGEIVTRKDYSYYEYDAKYSKNKKQALRNVYTFNVEDMGTEEARRVRSNIVYNADGTIDFAASTLNGELVGEDTFTGWASKEKISQTLEYSKDATTGVYSISSRKDYAYEAGRLVGSYTFDTSAVTTGEASKREKSVIVYNADGSIDFTNSTFT
ncbi:MAG: hypothetical protein Q8R38_05155, partial [Candidatus Omnitrophota bacterium]|nr:hypothetical protein [Candidatus Omnitrophota bacterium]